MGTRTTQFLGSRRRLLQGAASWPLVATAASPDPSAVQRVRAGQRGWPSEQDWSALAKQVGDAFVRVQSPWPRCAAAPASEECARLFKQAKNPYFLGDDPALTQT